MKKICIFSAILACVLLFCSVTPAVMPSVSAETLINFKPVLEKGKIYGIPVKTTVATLKLAYYNYDVLVYDADGKAVSANSSTCIGTGFTVKINSVGYTAVVMGDIDGDGQITVFDYSIMKLAYLGQEKISAAAKEAAEVEDGQIRALNYVKIKRAYFGTYDINGKYTCEPYDPIGDQSGWTPGWV